jgi:hypothetical protein
MEKKDKKYIEAIGRRKTSSARVRITEASKNSIVVNDKEVNVYFPTKELQKVVGGVFSTASGTVSAPNATATTIFTAPSLTNGTYIVSIGLNASSPANYNAVSIVSVDGAVLRTTALQVATLATITVSSQNIQATQSSGPTQTLYWTVTRVS